jgi:tRNA pseudouridine32 synthase/23S rRNA pseudouridine746 synthase
LPPPAHGIPLPARFPSPFAPDPHPLCRIAAADLQSRLPGLVPAGDGKMFGVLVVRDRHGKAGYLAAFSGLLHGTACHPGFVPPVFDLTDGQGFFKQGEAEISRLNARITVRCPPG